MTEFAEGQTIRGHYGNVWTRGADGWYSDSTNNWCFGDDTAAWLITLKVVTLPKSEPTGPVKMSKSDKTEPPISVYNYTLKE